MRFLDELKRRKVVRVAVVYGATAFVVLQAADIILPGLGVPGWAMSLVVVLTLLGFPLALVLAWALELTPDGIRRTEAADPPGPDAAPAKTPALLGRRALLISSLLAAVGIGMSAGWLLRPGPAEPGMESTRPAAASIAVLPFVNLSPDPDDAYFADGLTEEILNSLARVTSLRVSGRTSSFYFKDRSEDLRTIGARLGVDHVLEGSVRRSGDRLRIAVQLVEVEDGFHLWSEAYDRELDDIFVIQDDIARAIVEALRVELAGAPPVVASATESLPAYERLLEAHTLIGLRGAAGIHRAIVLLDEAVRLDPDFAPAWGTLAQAHSLLYWYDASVARGPSLARAEAAAGRALALDPDLARAHQVMGDVLRDQHRWTESEASYRRALELSPNDAESHVQYAQMLGRLGLARRALPFAARAAELDPLSPVSPTVLGLLLSQSGDREAGLQRVRATRSLAPDLLWIASTELVMYLASDDLVAALAVQRAISAQLQASAPEEPYAPLYELLRAEGDEGLAVLSLLRQAALGEPPEAGFAGWAWALHYGAPELALELMRAELRMDGRFDPLFSWSPYFAPVRRLEAFGDLARDLNMPRYWREHGWPEECRPGPPGQFQCGQEVRWYDEGALAGSAAPRPSGVALTRLYLPVVLGSARDRGLGGGGCRGPRVRGYSRLGRGLEQGFGFEGGGR
jgi:TolB-like protein